MTGWMWCPGAYGQCSMCRTFVTGLWRYFVSETTSTVAVCKTCGEEYAS